MRLRRGADGFTLVELLIAIVILGIITVPLSNVVIGYFRNTDATTARLIESHDAQISSAYWAQDVASIGTRSTTSPFALNQSVETGVAYNAGLYQCGAAGTPSAIVRLAWDDSSGPGTTATLVRVAYVVRAAPGQTQLTELHRLRCQGSAAVVSDVTLAHDLDPSTPLTVACLGTSGVNCAAAGPDVPKSVTLTLTIKDPKSLGAAYVVKLTGQRRQS
jgi:prepilin-type N-terminal cleavage/methylation domain-containing protein